MATIEHKCRIARTGGGRAWGWPLLAGIAALPLLLAEAAAPRDGAAMAAFLPGLSLEGVAAAIAPLDGRVLAEGSLPGLWLVQASAPGLAPALRRAGALLVFDPERLPGCFDRPATADRT